MRGEPEPERVAAPAASWPAMPTRRPSAPEIGRLRRPGMPAASGETIAIRVPVIPGGYPEAG
jgi:hypothetical protein